MGVLTLPLRKSLAWGIISTQRGRLSASDSDSVLRISGSASSSGVYFPAINHSSVKHLLGGCSNDNLGPDAMVYSYFIAE